MSASQAVAREKGPIQAFLSCHCFNSGCNCEDDLHLNCFNPRKDKVHNTIYYTTIPRRGGE